MSKAHGSSSLGASSSELQEESSRGHISAPDPQTVEMIRYYRQALKDHGFRLIESIRQNKDFGNPYILTKVVEHFKIDQIGSNYPRDVFDPLELTAEEFEDSFRRRHTTPAASSEANQYASLVEQVTQQSHSSQGAGPMPAVAPAQAAALAAALAAINARVADASTVRRDVPSQSEADAKRKSKWGQPSG